MMRTYDVAKRGLDIFIASALLVVTSPIQAVIAVLVRRDLGRPVLFRMTRPGRRAKPFEIIKFRTMRPSPGIDGPDGDGERLTALGRRLRATSLDELPSLVNVIRGDMSLVGPRPLLMSYVARYTPEQARRHDVRPGITGLAQVSGRNALPWPQRLSLDVEYVDRRSMLLDLSIMARTVATVARARDVSSEGRATAAEFMGDPRD